MNGESGILSARVNALIERHQELANQLAAPEVLDNPARLREVAQEHADLAPAAELGRSYLKILDELGQARELASSADSELVGLAEAETERLEAERMRVEAELRALLVPKDPLDDRPAVVEIRAGTGGDEAALFAADLFRMYSRFADRRGWKVEVLSTSEGVLGGVKEIIFVVRGKNAYGVLRYESGVHRVQRVPVTESSGRIHTSAASVAVLPEAEEVDVEIDPHDLKIDVFRSSGPGGQSVNTTDSAVRITHLPTGLVVSCQDEKSQHKNKAKALKVLRARLLDITKSERDEAIAKERKLQVSSGDRSAKVRTYNFPQNRVTDHRVNLTLYKLDEVMDGDLDELIEANRADVHSRLLEELEIAS
jgi:peptide chain release factor 1